MAVWEISSAIASLRSLLGDAATDKYRFKQKCFPAADGITVKFFVGETRLISDSLSVDVAGVLIAPSGVTGDFPTGTFVLSVAPVSNKEVKASYYFQWFTDEQLADFLTSASNSLSVEGIADPLLVPLTRPTILDFAAYYAYMYKAAQYASGLQASAEGYSVDKSKPSPNWKALAEMAWDKGVKKLEFARSNPLDKGNPAMRFTTYKLPLYQPQS